jgi:DNA repair exonuclease SbcCD ATPase subunit
MRHIRVLTQGIALGLSLLLSTAAFDRGALAQTHESHETQIAAFDSKLKTLQGLQDDLQRRAACLGQRDTQLTSQHTEKQLALGKLRSQEQELAQNIGRQQAVYEGFRSNLESEQNKLDNLRDQLESLKARKRAQEDWVRRCEAEKDWKRLWGLTCRADMDLSKAFGQIKNYEGDIAAAARREQIARESMESAAAELNTSEQRLIETRQRASEIDVAIVQTETALRNVSSMRADIRALIQPFRIVIDDLAAALNDAKDVNLADKRKRTMNLLSLIGEKADIAISDSAKVITLTDQTIGQDWMMACAMN